MGLLREKGTKVDTTLQKVVGNQLTQQRQMQGKYLA